MQIRAAGADDIPAIVNLLKISLGESLMPKSEAFWRWKHVENPFGVSPVLLAFQDEQLMGVRAFMHWQWQQGHKMYKAVRAVDTATHPDFQGKGIFKKLTLQLVDSCTASGIDFVFNTPNKSSKPGYIKMGWHSLGKMKVYSRGMLNLHKRQPGFDQQYAFQEKALLQVDLNANQSTTISTKRSVAYLLWRYRVNPNVVYYSFAGEAGGFPYLTLFRLKPYRFGMEFRICEQLGAQDADGLYQKHLMEVVRASGANLITCVQPLRGFPVVRARVGPEVTVRPIVIAPDFLSFRNWTPTLGDMELF
jgi:N-acetylglutamate synthase-like GNAT family acetyltransferase